MNPELNVIRNGPRTELGPVQADAAKGQVTWASDRAEAKESECGSGAEHGQVCCRMNSAPQQGRPTGSTAGPHLTAVQRGLQFAVPVRPD